MKTGLNIITIYFILCANVLIGQIPSNVHVYVENQTETDFSVTTTPSRKGLFGHKDTSSITINLVVRNRTIHFKHVPMSLMVKCVSLEFNIYNLDAKPKCTSVSYGTDSEFGTSTISISSRKHIRNCKDLNRLTITVHE